MQFKQGTIYLILWLLQLYFEDILQFTLVYYSNGFCFSILSILRPLAPTTWCSMLGTNQKQFSPEKLTAGSTGAWRLWSTQWTPVNSTPSSFLFVFLPSHRWIFAPPPRWWTNHLAGELKCPPTKWPWQITWHLTPDTKSPDKSPGGWVEVSSN